MDVPVVVGYKPYSCARPIHNAIDAMLELRAQGLRAADIADITIYRHPLWARYHAISRPRSFHEAQMSLPYSVALAVMEGKALPAQYARAARGDDAAMALSQKAAVESDEGLARGVSVRAVVRTTAGREMVAVADPGGTRPARTAPWPRPRARPGSWGLTRPGHSTRSVSLAPRRAV